jgi:hypothetical protein
LYVECKNYTLYREGSRMGVEKEISKYKLDLGGVQDVTW